MGTADEKQPMPLEDRLKSQAHQLGFELVGIARASEADGFARFQDWLAQGFAGDMDYLTRHAETRRHPAGVLPNVRSVVMVGLNYFTRTEPPPPAPGTGRVARYAWGQMDYHDLLRDRLNQLLAWVQHEQPDCQGRGVVDTAPLLERDFARRAGLGWFGKNTMLINKHLGSFFFLGALLLDVDLTPDTPHLSTHCGTCTACLDACPTEAFPQPGVLDARRCISYLTIELKSTVPEDLRPAMDDWVFGCDICQEVCPWNRKIPATEEAAFQPRADLAPVALSTMLLLSDEAFRQRYRGTPLFRSKRRGLVRNVALALGNQKEESALPALRKMEHDPDPVIRDAVIWAIEQIERQMKCTKV